MAKVVINEITPLIVIISFCSCILGEVLEWPVWRRKDNDVVAFVFLLDMKDTCT